MNKNEILGSDFTYIIDTSYGLSQDGYIATGTESIVYKGLKIYKDKNVSLSCVLKFKYKEIDMNVSDGNELKRVNVLERFKEHELQIFHKLQNCRSVVRIYDLIEDLGEFSLLDKHVSSGNKPVLINRNSFFCVVEEFVDGWSLEEYCRDEYWRLTEVKELQYGLKQKIGFHDFTPQLQNEKLESYKNDYNGVLRYQNEIYGFMINLCDIMEYVTDENHILHLDIKPDNIMVTRYGKELIMIDFGRSEYMNKDGFFNNPLCGADYNRNEKIERMFQYGTLGYAAPENYVEPINGSVFPFTKEDIQKGKITVESDIFSFGVTFWECLNIFELYTKSEEFAKDKGEGGSYDFYRNHILSDDAYCDRDLSFTSPYYHFELEKIIRKCTRSRTGNYLDKNNSSYYHSYKELKNDIEFARDSSPIIVKAENTKVRNTFGVYGVILGLISSITVLYLVLNIFSNYFAQKKWESIIADYNGTQIERLGVVSQDLMDSTSKASKPKVYEKTAAFLINNDNVIDYPEAKVLVSLLEQINDKKLLTQYIDEIIINADNRRYGEISSEIVKIKPEDDCIGYKLAEAVYYIEKGGSSETNTENILKGYELVQKYKDNQKFRQIVLKLEKTLNHDVYIKLIAKALEEDESKVQKNMDIIGVGVLHEEEE